MLRQVEYLVNLDGKITPDEQKALDDMRAGAEAIRALTPDSDPNEMIANAPASYWLDLQARYDAKQQERLPKEFLPKQSLRYVG